LQVIAWLVFAFDALWWGDSTTIVLTGERVGHFRAHVGPQVVLREERGIFLTSLVPPFPCRFQLGIDSSASLDTSAKLREEIANTLTACRLCRSLGMAIWAAMFLGAPLLFATFGLPQVWVHVLVILLAGAGVSALLFAVAWRRVFPADRNGWISDAVAIVLSPPAAITAADIVTRRSLAKYHPISVLEVLVCDGDLVRVARLLYFGQSASGGRDNSHLASLIEGMLERRGLSEDFRAAPTPESAEMRGFCPRCLVQLLRSGGMCPDCADVPIVEFVRWPR
jgi:hypothetical protein